jgi:hypothetical protein
MCCHVVMIHIYWILCLYSLIDKLIWTHEDSQFPPQMVLRILKICTLDFSVVSVILSVWIPGSYGFYFVDCSRFYFWVLWSIFNFSIPIFIVLPLDCICSQAHILTSLLYVWCPVTESCFQNVLCQWTGSRQTIVSDNFSHAMFSLLSTHDWFGSTCLFQSDTVWQGPVWPFIRKSKIWHI